MGSITHDDQVMPCPVSHRKMICGVVLDNSTINTTAEEAYEPLISVLMAWVRELTQWHRKDDIELKQHDLHLSWNILFCGMFYLFLFYC